ncbi:asparagine synthase (glutamine-hydrolyzing) [Candidatus Pelagibacter sp.]|nr:asparagine synthase (glutamine-hydrolyzing) [Candidatus Pelagibacter sp.]
MCGLIGTIGFRDDSRLDIKNISHRGPDATGRWDSLQDEFPVVLGHSRLSILDLTESGNQPLLSEDNRYVLIYNGEIYNFIELRSELESLGQVFYTKTDTEVLLKGLILEGPSYQLRCNGMWSFCLWDRKKKTALFGRDRFGKKPLFYHLLGKNRLVFASEMKGIYPFLNSIQPNENINIYLQKLFDYESTENCVIAGIKRLPPGHYAIYENGKFESRRWWNTLDHLEDVPNNYEEQVEKWREIFLDAVKIRMRSDVRIGTALSGGLDSSATFSAMNYLANKNNNQLRQAKDWQNGFCAHYPGSSLDESKWARIVTDTANANLQEVIINPKTSNWSINESFYQVEDPYLTLPIPMLETYRAIANSGIKVTIDGHGADELFSGYGHLNSAFKSSNPKQTAELVSIINSLQSGKYRINSGNLKINFIKKRLIMLLKPYLTKSKELLKTLIKKQDLELMRYKLEYSDQSHYQFKKLDPLSQDLYEIFHITILPTLLRNYDRYSMASGVEVRMPFMDHRLVTYTFSLPWTSKVGGTYTKRIMRDALKGILPEPIRTRRDKIGWNAPLHEWFKGPLKNEIEKIIKKKALPKKINKAWKKFQKKTNPNFDESQKVWMLLMPELWKRSLILKNFVK